MMDEYGIWNFDFRHFFSEALVNSGCSYLLIAIPGVSNLASV